MHNALPCNHPTDQSNCHAKHTRTVITIAAPKTANIKIAQGGLFTPSDKRTKPKVTQVSVPTPTGRIKRVATDNPKVRTEQLNTVWEKEREKLLALVRERNKEYGVVL